MPAPSWRISLCRAMLALGVAPAALVSPVCSQPIVHVAQGILEGSRSNRTTFYLGIPFAAPPTGALRWRPPAPPASWPGVRTATTFGASCLQADSPAAYGPFTKEFLETPAPSEDCLFLNVWAPAHARKLPVFVWIHGGGFLAGSAAVPIYNGANLARKGLVVVSINYRLGAFGFLAHPALSAEDAHHSSGNYALLDQIAALRWVKANIAAFGGNPANVTIAGQSAGAESVNLLLASPLAAGLFHRAIAQSGSGIGFESKSLAEAERDGLAFAGYLGAHTAADLRALPAEDIQAAVFMPFAASRPQPNVPKITFRAVVDHYVLPADGALAKTKPYGRVPLMTGFGADEGFATPETAAALEAHARARYGSHADAILALYPHATDADAARSAKLLARDRYLTSLILWTNARMKQAAQPIYRYEFMRGPPVAQGPSYGAFHTAEVPYVFGNLDIRLRPYGVADRRFASLLQRYWLNFARTGDPNGPGLPAWKRADPGGRLVFQIGDRPRAADAVSSPRRFEALRAFVADGGTLGLL